jgi:hypothetical protein
MISSDLPHWGLDGTVRSGGDWPDLRRYNRQDRPTFTNFISEKLGRFNPSTPKVQAFAVRGFFQARPANAVHVMKNAETR